MSDLLRIDIYGAPAIVTTLQRAIAALRPGGAVPQSLAEEAEELRDYAESVTHERSGSLASAHRVETTGLLARIYLDSGVTNPSGQSVGVYGPIEAARGGDHDFYGQTRQRYGDRMGVKVGQTLREIFG